MFDDFLKTVSTEIGVVLNSVKAENAAELVQSILKAQRIIVYGAGRVGLACKGFAMRLGHLGIEAYTVGDSTIPPVGKGDLVIVASSSGETQSVYDVAVLAKARGAHVAAITAIPYSRIAKMAESLLVIKAPTKFGPIEGIDSIQPMASLFEQSLQIFFDIIVLMLMKETHQTHYDLWARHANLD